MKEVKSLIGMLLVGCVCVALSAGHCLGAEPEVAATMVKKLLAAVKANDYDAFVAQGNATVKAGLTKQMLEGVSAQLASRMEKGYDSLYFGALKQQECEVYLWKLTYKDGGDDTLVKLVLKDGKVAGFWLQ
jgi:hypothetical protein